MPLRGVDGYTAAASATASATTAIATTATASAQAAAIQDQRISTRASTRSISRPPHKHSARTFPPRRHRRKALKALHIQQRQPPLCSIGKAATRRTPSCSPQASRSVFLAEYT